MTRRNLISTIEIKLFVTDNDLPESIRNENEETITKVKDKIDKTEIKTKLTSGVSTVGTMINDTVQKIEDKIQQEKHSSRPFWFKKNTTTITTDENGNEIEIDLEAGNGNGNGNENNNQPIIPKFRKHFIIIVFLFYFLFLFLVFYFFCFLVCARIIKYSLFFFHCFVLFLFFVFV